MSVRPRAFRPPVCFARPRTDLPPARSRAGTLGADIATAEATCATHGHTHGDNYQRNTPSARHQLLPNSNTGDTQHPQRKAPRSRNTRGQPPMKPTGLVTNETHGVRHTVKHKGDGAIKRRARGHCASAAWSGPRLTDRALAGGCHRLTSRSACGHTVT